MKKRILSLLLVLALAASLLVFPASAAKNAESGACGEAVTWTLDSNGLLTISGQGEMTDYDWDASPFYGRKDIRNIVIGSGVTTIGANVFNECGAVESVVIPDSVVSIGDDAFYYCRNLEEVTIPERVVSLGLDAFMGCTALTEVTIPESVEQIGNSAFMGCTSLEEITVAAGNPAYQSIRGALLTGDGTELICCPAGKSGAYVIPEGVVRIGDYALVECKNLTDVTIPASVTEIGCTAFGYCEQLAEIRIPAGVNTIGNQAFEGCLSLREIQVSEDNPYFQSVDGILMNRLRTELLRCPPMKTGAYVIPEGVKNIASGAFECCTGLTGVTIPVSVTEIGSSAFYDCQGLTSMVVPKGVSAIASNTFIGCGLKSIYLPESITEIRGFAFSGCNALTDVYFGGTEAQWNEIEIDAFENDPLLNAEVHCDVPDFCILMQPTHVQNAVGVSTFFNVVAMGSGLTYQWQYQTPASDIWEDCGPEYEGYRAPKLIVEVTGARNHYRYRCVVTDKTGSQLTSDAGELTVRSDADSLMYLLEDGEVTITGFNYDFEPPASLVIPDTIEGCPVTAIQFWAFSDCTALESVEIPDTVTSIGEAAFFNCSGLERVKLPANLTELPSNAFGYCRNLTQVTIPDSVTSISNHVFYNCSSLTEVTIPANVSYIDLGIFEGCTSLQEIRVDPDNEWYRSVDGVLMTEDGTRLLQYPGGRAGSYQVPEGVMVIDPRAFQGRTALTDLTIPASVNNIGDDAFRGCTAMTRIEVAAENPGYRSEQGVLLDKSGTLLICCPAGMPGEYTVPDHVSVIGRYAFSGCGELTDIRLHSGVASIEEGAFDQCSSITSMELPEGITTMESWMFSDCTSLQHVTIPKSVTSIGPYVFMGCWSLQSAEIPEGVTSISGAAFSDCRALQSVTLPDSVTSIGDGAFEGCTRLTSLTIPSRVSSIGSFAFLENQGMTSVVIPARVTLIREWTFYHCQNLTEVWIPAEVGSIGEFAFGNCINLTDVYFAGTEEQWNRIVVGEENEPLQNAKIHFNSPAFAITAQPQDYVGKLNSTASFTVAAEGTGLTYQWQISDDGENWTNSSVKRAVYTSRLTAEKNGRMVRCVVTDVNGDSLTSKAAVMRLVGPVITAQPQDYVGKLNSTASFTVAAEGDGLTYQWQISDDGENWTNSSVKRAAYTSKLTAEKNGRMVRCIVTDADGNAVTSEAAVMSLSGPVITTQPKNYTGKVNSTASFTVAATGDGLTYQWQISDDGGKTWTNSSVKKAVYTTKLTAEKDGRQVRCIVTDADGSKATSAAAVMKLSGPVITTQPKDYTGKVNSTASFTVVAEGEGLTYQWQVSDDNGATWSNSSVKKVVYTSKLTAAKDGRMVRCIVTDADGNAVTTNAVTMKIG